MRGESFDAMFLARWMQPWPELGCDFPTWLVFWRPGGFATGGSSIRLRTADLQLVTPVVMPDWLSEFVGVDRQRAEVGYALLHWIGIEEDQEPITKEELAGLIESCLTHVELGSDWSLREAEVTGWLASRDELILTERRLPDDEC